VSLLLPMGFLSLRLFPSFSVRHLLRRHYPRAPLCLIEVTCACQERAADADVLSGGLFPLVFNITVINDLLGCCLVLRFARRALFRRRAFLSERAVGPLASQVRGQVRLFREWSFESTWRFSRTPGFAMVAATMTSLAAPWWNRLLSAAQAVRPRLSPDPKSWVVWMV